MILNYKKKENLLSKYNLKRPETFLVASKEDAQVKAKEIGFPVVAKISSDKHLHRTELGGVFVDIENKKELEEAFEKLMEIEGTEGIIIQKQVEGVEFIVGSKMDDVFGPTIMFGTGGVLVEVFEDVSFRVAPITERDAFEMINEVKGRKLLEGFRGGPKIPKKKLVDLLVKTSKLVYKERVKELDFNPVIGNENGLYICDVKIAL